MPTRFRYLRNWKRLVNIIKKNYFHESLICIWKFVRIQVQDRRKSYSRPAKQYRKRRISIDSEPEEIEDDDEEIDAEKEKSKPKRRKKLVESEQKVGNS